MTNHTPKFAIFTIAVALTVGMWACSTRSQPGTQGVALSPFSTSTMPAAVTASPTTQGQPLSAEPGLWKFEATSAALRTPVKQCLTASDIADPQKVANVFGHPFNPMTTHQPDPGYHTLAEQTQQACQYSEMSTTADSLAFKYDCKGAFSSTEQASLKFDSPTHYSGVFNFTGDDQMDVRPASPTISTEGSRIADCTGSTF
jgi:hypothetical protein